MQPPPSRPVLSPEAALDGTCVRLDVLTNVHLLLLLYLLTFERVPESHVLYIRVPGTFVKGTRYESCGHSLYQGYVNMYWYLVGTLLENTYWYSSSGVPPPLEKTELSYG